MIEEKIIKDPMVWIFVLVLLIIGTAVSFEPVNWTLTSLTEGLLFLTAGIILLESIFEGKKFSLENLSNHPSDVVGIIIGVLAILISIGLFLRNSFLITHLSGIKGGLFIFLLAYFPIFSGILVGGIEKIERTDGTITIYEWYRNGQTNKNRK